MKLEVLNLPLANVLDRDNGQETTTISTYDGINCDDVQRDTDALQNGTFSLNLVPNSNEIRVDRQILGNFSTQDCSAPNDLMDAINGMDAFLMERIITFNVSQENIIVPNGQTDQFPTAFQMMAADVTINGEVRANDVSWVMQRAVSQICEYPQEWNYTDFSNGLPVPTNSENTSLDWRFVSDFEITQFSNDFTRSTNFPQSNGSQYWRDNVPDRSRICTRETGNRVNVSLNPDITVCNPYEDVLIHGVLLGDLDGSWMTSTTSNTVLRTTNTDQVIINLNDAVELDNGLIRVPVSFSNSSGTAVAIDMNLDYNEELFSIVSAEATAYSQNRNLRLSQNARSSDFLLSSFSLNSLDENEALHYLIIEGTDLDENTFGSGIGYINGRRVPLTISGTFDEITGIENTTFGSADLDVFPNPTQQEFSIRFNSSNTVNGSIKILDVNGKVMARYDSDNNSDIITVNTANWPKAVYILKWETEDGTLIKTERIIKD